MDTVQAKFTIPVPPGKWLAQVSTKYPHLQFSILSMLPLAADAGNVLLQVKGPDVAQMHQDLERDFPAMHTLIIHLGEDFLIVNVQTKDPWVLQTFLSHHVLMSYPIIIQNGRAAMEILADRSKIDKVLSEFEGKALAPTLTRIGRYAPAKKITGRQVDVLRFALEKGHFDIPRPPEASVRMIAQHFKISAAAVSEILRRACKTLAKQFLSI